MQRESGLLQGSCGSLHSSPQSAHVALPFKQPVTGGAVLHHSTPTPPKKVFKNAETDCTSWTRLLAAYLCILVHLLL